MLELDPQLTAVLAVAACAAAALLFVLVLLLALRLRRLTKDYRRAIDEERGEDVIAVLGRHEQTLDRHRPGRPRPRRAVR
jgi:hypothetical protein